MAGYTRDPLARLLQFSIVSFEFSRYTSTPSAYLYVMYNLVVATHTHGT